MFTMRGVNWKRGLLRLYVAFAAAWVLISTSVAVYFGLDSAKLYAKYAHENVDIHRQWTDPTTAISIAEVRPDIFDEAAQRYREANKKSASSSKNEDEWVPVNVINAEQSERTSDLPSATPTAKLGYVIRSSSATTGDART